MTSWSFFYPVLPPTGNHLYVRGVILKDKARKYKAEFTQWMAQTQGHVINEMPDPKSDPNLLFALHLAFYMPCLNAGWPKTSKERFKKIDTTNRIKFLEDCLRDALAIDDSLTFCASQRKIHSTEKQGVWMCLEVVDPATVGVPRVGP